MSFKQRLSQYRFLKNELKTGNAVDPEKTQAELKYIEKKLGEVEDARVRQALFMRYLSAERYSWQEVAKICHYSESRIRQLVTEYLNAHA